MFKLIFTIASITSTPVTTPTTTSATNSIDFADPAACARVLDQFRQHGDHSFPVQGVTVTLHFVAGRCVRDDSPNPDPSRFLEH